MVINKDGIYEKIVEYYELSEKIMEEIDKMREVSITDKESILYPVAEKIKKTADFLVENYILFLKNRRNEKVKQEILISLDKLLVEISVCKNKIYELYKKNNKNY